MKKKVVLAVIMGIMAASVCACDEGTGAVASMTESPVTTKSAQAPENTEESDEVESSDSENTLDDLDIEDDLLDDLDDLNVEEENEAADDEAVDEDDSEVADSVDGETDRETDENAADQGVDSDENVDDANVAELETFTGEFSGWADDHTVEVIIDGNPTAFAVEEENVKATLSCMEEGITFAFEVEQDGALRKIVKID